MRRMNHPGVHRGFVVLSHCLVKAFLFNFMYPNPLNTLSEVRSLLGRSLQLGTRTETLTAHSALLGALPELDSMAVVVILTTLEEHYGFVIDDDEISADTFATLGSLAHFVAQKLKH